MIILRKSGSLLASLFRKFDLFPTTNFIKFDNQSEYKTATGGIVSIIIIIIILILFSNKGVQILNRQVITSSMDIQIQTEPSQLLLATSVQKGFMFSVGVNMIDLNDPNITYFDISLVQNDYSPIHKLINSTQIPLVPCTLSHYAFSDKISQVYKKINSQLFRCPPIGQEFNVGGRFTSQLYSQFVISVRKCNSSKFSNCADDTLMQALLLQLGSFTLLVPFVNTIVNADNQDYLQTFIQDRNYFSFSTSYGVQVNAQIAQYEIETDVSIMPYGQIEKQYINTIPDLFMSKNFEITDNNYASIIFSKSCKTITYTRSFTKIDEYFSYIGGLFGSFLVLFSIFHHYSQYAFFVELASKMLIVEQTDISFGSFNFLFYLGIMLKNLLNKIKLIFRWERGDLLLRSIEQMRQQLDISLLMKKIIFLQEAVSSILSQHQLETLHLNDKRSFSAMIKWRQRLKIAQIIKLELLAQIQNVQKTDFPINKQIQLSESSLQCRVSSFNLQTNLFLKQKVKTNIEKVINESRHNDIISQRILNKFSLHTLQRICFQEQIKKQQMGLQQVEQVFSCSSEISKNAVSNSYSFKLKRNTKEQIIIDNIQD